MATKKNRHYEEEMLALSKRQSQKYWASVNQQDYMTSDLYRDQVDAKLRELNESIRLRQCPTQTK